MENKGRKEPFDSRIHMPAVQDDLEQICLPAQLSALTLTKGVDQEGSFSLGMDLKKMSSSPSKADSWEIMGVGSTFADPPPFDQHFLSDDEVYGANGIPSTKSQFYHSRYSQHIVSSCTDPPLFSWTNNLGQDMDVCSERTPSLTTARTVVSERIPDSHAAENPLCKGAAEDRNLLPAQSVTSDPTPRTLDTAQLSSSAHRSTEALLWWDGDLKHDLPWVAKSLPEVVYPLETGENQHGKEGSSAISEHRGGAASSNQRKSTLSGNKRKAGSVEDYDGGNGDQKSDRARRSKTSKEANSQQLWACPFAKGEPWRHPKCLNAAQDKISYVKQHLYRSHGPVYCRRCGKQFSDSTSTDGQSAENIRDRHESGCQSHNIVFERKMTYDQERKVKEAKSRDRVVTDEARWFQIFDIVCPGTTRPDSPYAQPATIEVLGSFRNNLRQEIGQRAVRAAASSALPHGHLEVCIRLVEETVSSFIQSLEEHDDGNNVVNPNPDQDHVRATTGLTISPSSLEWAANLSSASSTASNASTIESPVSTSLSISDSAWDPSATLGYSADKSRYEFKAGVQTSCEDGEAVRQQHNTVPAPSHASEVPLGESLDVHEEPSTFDDDTSILELYRALEQNTGAELDDLYARTGWDPLDPCRVFEGT